MKPSLAHERRSLLPSALVRFLHSRSEGTLSGITWFEPERHRFTAHFTRDDAPFEDRVFRYKSAIQQARLSSR